MARPSCQEPRQFFRTSLPLERGSNRRNRLGSICDAPVVVRVYVVRHAEAAPGHPDELRTLTPEGHGQAQSLADRLAEEDLDAVLSSPLLRARQTAEPIARAAGVPAEADQRLAPGADSERVRSAVAGRGGVVVVVGHQPDCSEVLAGLGGPPGAAFPPAGVHAVDVEL
jgi:phosphohistidine phosphatase